MAGTDIEPLRHREIALGGEVELFNAAGEASSRFNRLVADELPVLISFIDKSLTYRFANRTYEEWFGAAPETVIGQTVLELVGPEGYELRRPFMERALAGEAVLFEANWLYADGRTRKVDIRYLPQRDESGDVYGFYAFVLDITDRKAAEDVLRASEARFRGLTEAIPGFVWSADAHGTVDYASPRWCDYSGFDINTSLQEAWSSFLHPDDHARVAPMWADSVQSGRPFDCQYRLRRHDGTYRWWLARALQVRGAAGAAQWVGTCTDIDDQKRAELARRETEERQAFTLALADELRGLSDPAKVMSKAAAKLGAQLDACRVSYGEVDEPQDVIVADHDWTNGKVPSIAGRFSLSGFGPAIVAEARSGRTVRVNNVADEPRIADLLPAYTAVQVQAFVAVPLVKEGKLEAVLSVNQDAPRLWSEIEVSLIEDVAERTWAAVQQTRAETALRRFVQTLESEVAERTRDRNRMWQLSTDLMLVARFDATIAAVNPAWKAHLGWEEQGLLGEPVLDLVHPDDLQVALEELERLRKGQPSSRFESRHRHRDGSYRWVSWRAVSDSGMIHAVGRDVTTEKEAAVALKEAEGQLRQAQKMEAVGQLTGGVAHDFNNLLTIIRSSVDLMRRRDLSEERRRRYVDAISDTVDRASKLTGQLLAFARRQPLKPEVFNVSRRVESVAEMLRPLVGARVKILLHLGDPPCLAQADVGQFDTALVNLAVNARDAMSGEGNLILQVSEVEDLPQLRGEARRSGRFIGVSITDTGVGIPDANLEKIFEPFYTTKGVGKGTGLGLSQVFGFAKQSGGEIHVVSEPGRGSTFTIYLPTAEPDDVPEIDPPLAIRTRTNGRGARVLVVEDNEEVGRFSTEMLRDLGYETAWASDAANALQLLASETLEFDLVFTDVVMPGMNGVDLAKIVQSMHPTLPVVLTSGYSDVLAEQGRHGLELIQKPYSVEELSRVLRKALHNQKGGNQLRSEPSGATSDQTAILAFGTADDRLGPAGCLSSADIQLDRGA